MLGLSAGLAAAPGIAAAQAGVAAPPTGPAGAQQLPEALVGRPQPELTYEEPLPEERQLGWAVAGVGHFAQNRAIPGIVRSRRAKMTGLISGNADKAQRVGAAYAIGTDHLYSYETMDRLAQDDTIDVVYVITPNAVHEEVVIRAFEAGKHVLCEKPFATTEAACQRMIDAGEAAGRKLMIAYRAHFEPHNVMAKRMLDEGVLGDVWFATSDHHRVLDPEAVQDQWRMVRALAGGGSLPDIGIYGLNGIIWFFGESPARLRGTLASPPGDERFGDVEAFSRVELEFPSGRVAQLSSGYTGDKKRIDLIGSQATATLDPATSYEGNRLNIISTSEDRLIVPPKLSRFQFDDEIDHFSRAIQEGTDILTPASMGLRDVRLILAIQESARSGRWIDVRPDGSMA